MDFKRQNLEKIENLRNTYEMINSENESKYQIFRYGDETYNRLEVSPRFEKIILTHVISLYLKDNELYLPPIFLLIEGVAGEGKTSQAIASCIQHGIKVVYISGSQLSGSHEHDAIDVMEAVYKQALMLREQKENVSIIIDDFHLSNASIDTNVKRTINSTLLTGYLMNLTQNKSEAKIPIILTGNDFSQIYKPLVRAGRADQFKWIPNYEEKRNIVRNVLGEFSSINPIEFEQFYSRCCNASVAEFVQLINDYRKSIISDSLCNIGCVNSSMISDISKYVEKNRKK